MTLKPDSEGHETVGLPMVGHTSDGCVVRRVCPCHPTVVAIAVHPVDDSNARRRVERALKHDVQSARAGHGGCANVDAVVTGKTLWEHVCVVRRTLGVTDN